MNEAKATPIHEILEHVKKERDEALDQITEWCRRAETAEQQLTEAQQRILELDARCEKWERWNLQMHKEVERSFNDFLRMRVVAHSLRDEGKADRAELPAILDEIERAVCDGGCISHDTIMALIAKAR